MKSLLRLALFVVPALAFGQAPDPAARAVSCMALPEARSSLTPPDLHQAVIDCVGKDRLESAAELFALANVYASFDAERVADKSAGQAKKILIMDTFSRVPEDKRAGFNLALQRMVTTPQGLAKLCGQIDRVGKPSYYPAYMVVHGMKVLNANPQADALVKDFDATSVWTKLRADYLNCP